MVGWCPPKDVFLDCYLTFFGKELILSRVNSKSRSGDCSHMCFAKYNMAVILACNDSFMRFKNSAIAAFGVVLS